MKAPEHLYNCTFILKSLFTVTRMLRGFFFAFLLLAVNAQNNSSGFISIDCGISEGSNYTDATTGVYYTSDASFISSGVSKSIQPLYQTNSLEQQFLNLRSFPQGTRNCYILRPPLGKGHKYLIRASFLYGNYDSLNRLPTFDLHLGVDLWDTVSIANASIPLSFEMVHISSSDYIDVCLVKTSLGYPFISALELRPLNISIYTTKSGSLDLYTRVYFAPQPAQLVRYKDDADDRIWSPFQLRNTTTLHTASRIRYNEFQQPLIAMSTPTTPVNASFLYFEWTPVNASDQFYVYMHFAEVLELQANESRKFDIYINGDRWNTGGPIAPAYLSASTVYSTSPEIVSPIYRVTINQTRDSTLPPIINALEIYNLREILHSQTDDNDVDAMLTLKSMYSVIRNWQGDPCLPKAFVWVGVSCSYNGFDSPRIISLNLSSSGLTGMIAPSILNLTMIEILDLSYNNLTGPVPNFLTGLASLKVLNLKGNNLTGLVPAQLLQKSRNGLLSMSIDPSNNSNPCQSVPCKRKKNRVVVPVIASVIAAIFVLLAALGILWTIRRRNQQASKSLSRKDSLARQEES